MVSARPPERSVSNLTKTAFQGHLAVRDEKRIHQPFPRPVEQDPGCERPLADFQKRQPGCEVAIANRYFFQEFIGLLWCLLVLLLIDIALKISTLSISALPLFSP
jgi:hypothetical protein